MVQECSDSYQITLIVFPTMLVALLFVYSLILLCAFVYLAIFHVACNYYHCLAQYNSAHQLICYCITKYIHSCNAHHYSRLCFVSISRSGWVFT